MFYGKILRGIGCFCKWSTRYITRLFRKTLCFNVIFKSWIFCLKSRRLSFSWRSKLKSCLICIFFRYKDFIRVFQFLRIWTFLAFVYRTSFFKKLRNFRTFLWSTNCTFLIRFLVFLFLINRWLFILKIKIWAFIISWKDSFGMNWTKNLFPRLNRSFNIARTFQGILSRYSINKFVWFWRLIFLK